MTKYKCNQCGAEDSDRTTSSPLALVCWNCRAGRDTKGYQHQIEIKEGMFQVVEGKFPWEV